MLTPLAFDSWLVARPIILILALLSLAWGLVLLIRRLRTQRRLDGRFYLVRLLIFSLLVVLAGIAIFANFLARQRANMLIHPGRTMTAETPGDYKSSYQRWVAPVCLVCSHP
jgi:hypothetical protein